TAGGGIGHRARGGAAVVPAVQLGQPVVEHLGGVEEGAGQEGAFAPASGAGEGVDDDGGVVGPDGSAVVGQRVEGPVVGGHGAQAVAAGHAGRDEQGGDGVGLGVGEHAGAEEVADVAGEGVDRPFGGVQGEGGVASVRAVHPEAGAEPFGHGGGVIAPAGGAGAAEGVQQRGAVQGGLVGVPLHLGEGDGRVGLAAVVEAHGVAGVLPPLVGQAAAV